MSVGKETFSLLELCGWRMLSLLQSIDHECCFSSDWGCGLLSGDLTIFGILLWF